MNIVNIFQEGGIGDLIISLPLIQHYFYREGFEINLYSSMPEIASFFLPFVKSHNTIQGFRRDKNDFDYCISISDMIFFYKKPHVKLPSYLQEIYENWLKVYPEWMDILNRHPFLANEMAHKALEMKLNRFKLPFYFIGKSFKEYQLIPKIDGIKFPTKFITVHDGFDSTGHYKFIKSTKSWEISYWEKFVSMFKEKYPDILVIQLGGVKHQKIKNVDINLAGQLSFEKSMEYLKSSLVHVDGEGGLVHARALFKKPSVVIFGPTNIDYFSYSKNINIPPKICGNCWWKKSDWMKNCVKDFESAKCMDSILPQNVLDSVSELLTR